LDNIHDEFKESWKGGQGTISEGPAADSSALTCIPTHPLSHRVRDKFLELDMSIVSPEDIALFMDFLTQNVICADLYLLLTKDPEHCAPSRRAWIELQLKEL
jgi:hypothetical protein